MALFVFIIARCVYVCVCVHVCVCVCRSILVYWYMIRHYKLEAFVRTSHYETSQGRVKIHVRQAGIERGVGGRNTTPEPPLPYSLHV